MSFQPGEVYLADIFEGGTRPVVIVSRDELGRGSIALAVPVTSAATNGARCHLLAGAMRGSS